MGRESGLGSDLCCGVSWAVVKMLLDVGWGGIASKPTWLLSHLAPCGLSDWGPPVSHRPHPRLLGSCASPTGPLVSSKPARQGVTSKIDVTIVYNTVTYTQSHTACHLCHILLVRSHRPCPHFRGGRHRSREPQEAGVPRVCLPTSHRPCEPDAASDSHCSARERKLNKTHSIHVRLKRESLMDLFLSCSWEEKQ